MQGNVTAKSDGPYQQAVAQTMQGIWLLCLHRDDRQGSNEPDPPAGIRALKAPNPRQLAPGLRPWGAALGCPA